MATTVPEEVEAKLLLRSVADLRRIGRLTEVGAYRLRRLPAQHLHSRYFDTADLALARQGVALRVRRNGRHWELTAKWEGHVDGPIHSRPELTVVLREEPASPFRLTEPEMHRQLAARIAGRRLQVVLISEIHRRRFELLPAAGEKPAAALAEIALDEVRLHGEGDDGPQRQFCELEIEQRGGTVADLEAVVALLRERFALEASTETKFSRGMALLHGFRRRPLDAVLSPADDIVAVARKITAKQLAQIRRNDPGTRAGEDPEFLHDMRVAVRRLRAAVKELRLGFPPALHESLRSELRWLGSVLGEVRDLDVQRARSATLAEALPPALRAGLAAFETHLEHDRRVRIEAMRVALDAGRYNALLLRLERFAEGRTRFRASAQASGPAGRFAADAVRRAHRKLRQQGRVVHREPRPEELHALRICAKRLRYVLEFFADLGGKPARRVTKRLERLQDLLGAHNDAMVTATFVQSYAEGPGASASAAVLLTLGAVIGNAIGRGERMRRRFGRSWKRFMRKRNRVEVKVVIESLAAADTGSRASVASAAEPARQE